MENEEIKWTDDRVRWPDDDTSADDSNTGEDEEECPIDIFKDQNPYETFDFHYKRNDRHDNGSIIHIKLQGYKSDSDEIWKSTGLTIWRAADFLCRYLVEHYYDDNLHLLGEGKRILELGAGLGLVGILAHHLASSKTHTILTDGDSDALIYLRDNVKSNMSRERGTIAVKQLIWGRQTSADFLASDEKIDLIIASDIVYSPVIIEPLWETVETLLSRSGTFIMAYAKRKVPVSIEEVLEAAKRYGFDYTKRADDENGLYLYSFHCCES